MKEINELDLPSDIHYSKDHGWGRKSGDLLIIGITDYAQDQLGDVVYVGLPETDSQYDADQAYGSVESVKTMSELFMPVAGIVVEINARLEDAPELVNAEPYAGGWILKVKPDDPDAIHGLMPRDAYLAMISG